MKKIKFSFTLIELLVVISIIGILTSILLPSLANAKLHAQSTLCKNYLRTFGMAYMDIIERGVERAPLIDPITGQDVNAYKNAPPGAIIDSHTITAEMNIELGSMHTRARDILCPTVKQNKGVRADGSTYDITWSYGYNGFYCSNNSGGPGKFTFVSKLAYPSALLLFADSKNNGYQTGASQAMNEPHTAQTLRSNIAAYDGHVETSNHIRANNRNFNDTSFAKYMKGANQ